jgi:2-hydroxy-6-oxonona-2,4-dienedioate hydrolase
VAKVLDGLDLKRAHLVGSSFGGYLALRAAMATPERVGRTVQLGAPPAIPGGTIPLFMRLMAIPGFPWLISSLPPSERQSVSTLRQIGHGKSIDAGVIPQVFFDWYLALMRYTPTMRNEVRLISSGMTTRGWDSWLELGPESLARASSPTYFLWGEDEAFGSEAVARNLVAHMPDAKLRMIPAAGHLPWLDDPSLIAKKTAAFLTEEPSYRAATDTATKG